MKAETIAIAIRLGSALAAGSPIGLERSYHGRPAGFRTHAIVCLATALLMLVSVYEWRWLGGAASVEEARRADPTRVAQGIMTGIGFIGAGAIIKDGLIVRGLTTAASIWITAAIGVLVGIGFYFPAMQGRSLSRSDAVGVFRWVSRGCRPSSMPSSSYALRRTRSCPSPSFGTVVAKHDFTIAHLSYAQSDKRRLSSNTA